MCFVNEVDWSAEVQDISERAVEKPTRCMECGRTMQAGTVMEHIYQQEHELCCSCVDGFCDCTECDDSCNCQCEEPDYGETFGYDCCLDCWDFLEAVKAAEMEEGCSEREARPLLTEMVKSIGGMDADRASKYFRSALRLKPHLKASGYLGWLWRKMFN